MAFLKVRLSEEGGVASLLKPKPKKPCNAALGVRMIKLDISKEIEDFGDILELFSEKVLRALVTQKKRIVVPKTVPFFRKNAKNQIAKILPVEEKNAPSCALCLAEGKSGAHCRCSTVLGRAVMKMKGNRSLEG